MVRRDRKKKASKGVRGLLLAILIAGVCQVGVRAEEMDSPAGKEAEPGVITESEITDEEAQEAELSEPDSIKAEDRALSRGWKREGGSWYYYDSNGKKYTGWLKHEGSWYYLEEDGRMAAGWRYMKEQWYYFAASGVMASEQWVDDCYLTGDGSMAVNTWIGKYYVGSDGKWIPGYSDAKWVLEGDRWWYRYFDGTYPKSCWKEIGSSRYYFDEGGWLVTGWLEDKGKWYYLTENGMKKNEWLLEGKTWYYLNADGSMAVGWIKDGASWYYMNPRGMMQTGWLLDGKTWYFLKQNGALQTGWYLQGKTWYYLKSNGGMATGWQQAGKNWYYMSASGVMQTGWLLEGKTWYYLKSDGAMQTGWFQQGKTWYYLKGNGGMATGWQQAGKTWYYMSAGGAMQTGWLKQGKIWYYLKSDGAMQTGWLQQGKIWYYLKSDGAMATGWMQVGKSWYYFYGSGSMAVNTYIDGCLINRKGEYYVPAVGTIKGLLQNAMVPVGSTMYVYGGGWDEDATRKGPSPQWKKFYEKQNSSYDYNTTRYQSENGLDCSGFVGWSVYNALNDRSGKRSCTVTSTEMVSNYASRGWGSNIDRSKVKDYRAGDVMGTTCGCHNHVYLVIGQCSDGSVVFVHSSPKGVQINGTAAPSGSYSSKAISLANSYMKKYFPEWNKKFGTSSGPAYYLSHFSQMRWDISGNKVMKDPDGYTKKSAEQVLKDLFDE